MDRETRRAVKFLTESELPSVVGQNSAVSHHEKNILSSVDALRPQHFYNRNESVGNRSHNELSTTDTSLPVRTNQVSTTTIPKTTTDGPYHQDLLQQSVDIANLSSSVNKSADNYYIYQPLQENAITTAQDGIPTSLMGDGNPMLGQGQYTVVNHASENSDPYTGRSNDDTFLSSVSSHIIHDSTNRFNVNKGQTSHVKLDNLDQLSSSLKPGHELEIMLEGGQSWGSGQVIQMYENDDEVHYVLGNNLPNNTLSTSISNNDVAFTTSDNDVSFTTSGNSWPEEGVAYNTTVSSNTWPEENHFSNLVDYVTSESQVLDSPNKRTSDFREIISPRRKQKKSTKNKRQCNNYIPRESNFQFLHPDNDDMIDKEIVCECESSLDLSSYNHHSDGRQYDIGQVKIGEYEFMTFRRNSIYYISLAEIKSQNIFPTVFRVDRQIRVIVDAAKKSEQKLLISKLTNDELEFLRQAKKISLRCRTLGLIPLCVFRELCNCMESCDLFPIGTKHLCTNFVDIIYYEKIIKKCNHRGTKWTKSTTKETSVYWGRLIVADKKLTAFKERETIFVSCSDLVCVSDKPYITSNTLSHWLNKLSMKPRKLQYPNRCHFNRPKYDVFFKHSWIELTSLKCMCTAMFAVHTTVNDIVLDMKDNIFRTVFDGSPTIVQPFRECEDVDNRRDSTEDSTGTNTQIIVINCDNKQHLTPGQYIFNNRNQMQEFLTRKGVNMKEDQLSSNHNIIRLNQPSHDEDRNYRSNRLSQSSDIIHSSLRDNQKIRSDSNLGHQGRSSVVDDPSDDRVCDSTDTESHVDDTLHGRTHLRQDCWISPTILTKSSSSSNHEIYSCSFSQGHQSGLRQHMHDQCSYNQNDSRQHTHNQCSYKQKKCSKTTVSPLSERNNCVVCCRQGGRCGHQFDSEHCDNNIIHSQRGINECENNELGDRYNHSEHGHLFDDEHCNNNTIHSQHSVTQSTNNEQSTVSTQTPHNSGQSIIPKVNHSIQTTPLHKVDYSMQTTPLHKVDYSIQTTPLHRHDYSIQSVADSSTHTTSASYLSELPIQPSNLGKETTSFLDTSQHSTFSMPADSRVQHTTSSMPADSKVSQTFDIPRPTECARDITSSLYSDDCIQKDEFYKPRSPNHISDAGNSLHHLNHCTSPQKCISPISVYCKNNSDDSTVNAEVYECIPVFSIQSPQTISIQDTMVESETIKIQESCDTQHQTTIDDVNNESVISNESIVDYSNTNGHETRLQGEIITSFNEITSCIMGQSVNLTPSNISDIVGGNVLSEERENTSDAETEDSVSPAKNTTERVKNIPKEYNRGDNSVETNISDDNGKPTISKTYSSNVNDNSYNKAAVQHVEHEREFSQREITGDEQIVDEHDNESSRVNKREITHVNPTFNDDDCEVESIREITHVNLTLDDDDCEVESLREITRENQTVAEDDCEVESIREITHENQTVAEDGCDGHTRDETSQCHIIPENYKELITEDRSSSNEIENQSTINGKFGHIAVLEKILRDVEITTSEFTLDKCVLRSKLIGSLKETFKDRIDDKNRFLQLLTILLAKLTFMENCGKLKELFTEKRDYCKQRRHSHKTLLPSSHKLKQNNCKKFRNKLLRMNRIDHSKLIPEHPILRQCKRKLKARKCLCCYSPSPSKMGKSKTKKTDLQLCVDNDVGKQRKQNDSSHSTAESKELHLNDCYEVCDDNWKGDESVHTSASSNVSGSNDLQIKDGLGLKNQVDNNTMFHEEKNKIQSDANASDCISSLSSWNTNNSCNEHLNNDVQDASCNVQSHKGIMGNSSAKTNSSGVSSIEDFMIPLSCVSVHGEHARESHLQPQNSYYSVKGNNSGAGSSKQFDAPLSCASVVERHSHEGDVFSYCNQLQNSASSDVYHSVVSEDFIDKCELLHDRLDQFPVSNNFMNQNELSLKNRTQSTISDNFMNQNELSSENRTKSTISDNFTNQRELLHNNITKSITSDKIINNHVVVDGNGVNINPSIVLSQSDVIGDYHCLEQNLESTNQNNASFLQVSAAPIDSNPEQVSTINNDTLPFKVPLSVIEKTSLNITSNSSLTLKRARRGRPPQVHKEQKRLQSSREQGNMRKRKRYQSEVPDSVDSVIDAVVSQSLQSYSHEDVKVKKKSHQQEKESSFMSSKVKKSQKNIKLDKKSPKTSKKNISNENTISSKSAERKKLNKATKSDAKCSKTEEHGHGDGSSTTKKKTKIVNNGKSHGLQSAAISSKGRKLYKTSKSQISDEETISDKSQQRKRLKKETTMNKKKQ